MPFDIPDSWTWIRLKDLIHIQTGASFKKEQSIQESKEGFIRVLRGGNILPFQYLLKGDDLYIPQELVSDDIILKKNDLITPAVTSLENIGKIAVINSELNGVTAGGFVYIFRPYLNGIVISNLIADYVSSSAYQSMMKDITKKSGQAFYNMNKEKLLQLYFPIAPFAEMKRIVKKVNKCEPLIAAYSIAEGKLSALEEEFPEKLKKSILQYAIEGKLVKQDPNDEPASVLLERIKQEKEQLIREGKIKRDKNESYIYQGDDKNYYEKIGKNTTLLNDVFLQRLPDYLSKQRFKTVLDVRDGTHNSPSYCSEGYPFISSKNLKNGSIDYNNIKFISKTDFDNYNKRSNAEENDILFGMIGTIGNPAIIKNAPFKFAFKNMALIKLSNNLFISEYVYYYLLWIESKFKQEASGGIQKFISLDYIRNSIIPIPSINYQQSLVTKIRRILAL